MSTRKRDIIKTGNDTPIDQLPLIIDGVSFWYFLTTNSGGFSATPTQQPDFGRWPNLNTETASDYFSQAATRGADFNGYLSDTQGPWNVYPQWLGIAYGLFGTAVDANVLARIWLLLVTRSDFSETPNEIAYPVALAGLIGQLVPSHKITVPNAHALLCPTIKLPFQNTINLFGTYSSSLRMPWQGGGSHPTVNELVASTPATVRSGDGL